MQDYLLNLLHGFIVGMAVSMPLGPAGLFSVQRTISKGRVSGFVSGMGVALSDTVFSALALFSLAFIQRIIDNNKVLLLFVGGLIICAFGIKIFLTNPIKQIRSNHATTRYWEDFLAGFLMTITNPGALLIILGVFAIIGHSVDSFSSVFSISFTILGVFIGAALWWYSLSLIVNRFRKKFRLRQLWAINRVSGVVIIVLGILSLLEGLWQCLVPVLLR